LNKKIIERIARSIAEFHSKAEGNKRIDEFGSLNIIKINWEENFKQTLGFINKTISLEMYKTIHDNVIKFMKKNYVLFEKRVKDKKIRDCHGDIHSGNIFIDDNIYIFDAIEFNERFRYGDCASDIAFLAMDLDFKNRKDLSSFLIKKYIKYSHDSELERILIFYKCYRAYVRGKVISFKLNDPNTNNKSKDEAKKEASSYFNLATHYAKKL
jgi:aminoglycoside phosphotransferase family enzyme